MWNCCYFGKFSFGRIIAQKWLAKREHCSWASSSSVRCISLYIWDASGKQNSICLKSMCCYSKDNTNTFCGRMIQVPLCQPWRKYRVLGLARDVYAWIMIDYTLSWQCIFNSLIYLYVWLAIFTLPFLPLVQGDKFCSPLVHPCPLNDLCEIRSQWWSRNCSLGLQAIVPLLLNHTSSVHMCPFTV